MEEAVDQRNAISLGGYPDLHSLVRRLSVQLSASGRDDARARSLGRPLDDQPLGIDLRAMQCAPAAVGAVELEDTFSQVDTENGNFHDGPPNTSG